MSFSQSSTSASEVMDMTLEEGITGVGEREEGMEGGKERGWKGEKGGGREGI